MEKENLNSIYNISLTGRLAMRTSGSTILVTMLALMRTTVVREMLMVMTLTGAVSTVNSQSTAPTVTTADGVASAHDRNRQFFLPIYVSQVFCVCSYLAEPQMETRPKFMSNHCRNIVKAKINLQILFPCIFFFLCFICIINNNSLSVAEPSVQEPA